MDEKTIQMIIAVGLFILLLASLIIDGTFGERCFGMIMATLGVFIGYLFRKSNEISYTSKQ